MKKLLLIATLACATLAQAQFIETTTPEPGTSWNLSYTASGKFMVLTDYVFHEARFNIPWGFDFSAGHELSVGFETDSEIEFNTAEMSEANKVAGYFIYGKKGLGGNGYIKAAVGFVLGDNRAGRFEAMVSIGRRF